MALPPSEIYNYCLLTTLDYVDVLLGSQSNVLVPLEVYNGIFHDLFLGLRGPDKMTLLCRLISHLAL